ncbi:MAG TPA: TRAP transporter substrate-binding protein [Atribacterota bacterium]|nr:TRAP transporter substrate-binding protein [Atribacterota bacterium]
MKKLWILVLLVVLFISLTMGGGAETVIKYAHNQQIGSPQDEGARIFKEKVEELSGGQVRIDIYPNNQLGSLREVIESVQGGQIEMAQQPLGMIANFVPVLNINDLPYLYPSEDILWKVLDGPMGGKLNEYMYDAGFINLGYHSGGPKQFSANIPLRTTDDFSKVNLRAMPAPIVIATFEALGSHPVPIEFSELYNSLQQRVVDGQENPMQTVSMLHLYEVQKYVTYTNHSWMIYANIVNKRFWDSLSTDVQRVMLQAMKETAPIQRKIMRDAEQDYIQESEANGCEVIMLSPNEVDALRKATLSVHEKFVDIIGRDLYDSFIREIESLK